MNNAIYNKKLSKIENDRNQRTYWDLYAIEAAKLRLGQEIIINRQRLGLSQSQLAKQAKTTQRVISNIENAEFNTGFELLFRIAKSLSFISDSFSKVFDCPAEIETVNVVSRFVSSQPPIPLEYPEEVRYESKSESLDVCMER